MRACRTRDNIYIFSMGRSDFGRVLFSRGNIEKTVGRSLFNIYSVSPEETDFLKRRLNDSAFGAYAVLGHNTEKRALLIFGAFYNDSSMLLAVEPRFPAETVAKLICCGAVKGISQSKALSSLAQYKRTGERSALSRAEGECASYLVCLLNRMDTIIQDKSSLESREEYIARMAEQMSALAGVHCIWHMPQLLDGGRRYRAHLSEGMVFGCNICAILLLVMGMMSRQYGESGGMDVCIDYSEDLVVLSAGFRYKKFPEGGKRSIMITKEGIVTSSNIPIEFRIYKDAIVFTLIPFYSDEGAVGLKQRPHLLDYGDEYEII